MKLTIDVTADDIAKGRREDALQCPVARAAQRALREASGDPDLGVEAGSTHLWIWHTTKPLWHIDNPLGPPLKAPKTVGAFVKAFDAKGRTAVKPFSFRLDV